MKVYLIEDEPMALRRLEKLVTELKPTWEVIGSSDSVDESKAFLQSNKVDLILSDIQLSDGISFDIFEDDIYNGAIIFTTAYDSYAIKAFKLNSIDYILKPLMKEQLAFALNKFENQQQAINSAALLKPLFSGEKSSFQKRILAKMGSQIKIIETDLMAIYYTENKINYAVDFQAVKIPIDETLEEVMSLLSPKTFFRVNRQMIIHYKAIQKISSISSSRVKVIPPFPFPIDIEVSKEKTPLFKEWILNAG